MVNRINIHAAGLALALAFFVLSVICLVLVLIAADFALMLFGSFLHGIDLTQIAIAPEFNGKTILGFSVAIIGGYVLGVLYATLYNKFVR